MKKVHHTWVTAYCKPNEDKEEIKKGLSNLFPFSLEDEKIKIDETTVSGFDEKDIDILQVKLSKTRHTNRFLEYLKKKLTKNQKRLIIRQKESRLDLRNHFFIRFDKDKLKEDKFFLTDKGNCYHIKMTIAAYPSKRENALKKIEEIF